MSKNTSTFPRTAILNLVGLTRRHIGAMPFVGEFLERKENLIVDIEPQVPAVTSSMQATYLTGKLPGEHGIVGNMWYDREYAEHRCWKQSNHLVKGRKLWEHIREEFDPEYTCAKLFWWNNMYSSADYQVTPRPIYGASGKKVFDIQTWPMELRPKLKRKLGKFPFPAFWGPRAGIESSQWIAKSARWFEDKHAPNLSLVYLPHLDYCLQKVGPYHPSIIEEMLCLDEVVKDLVLHLEKRGVSVVMLSEYGITQVNRPIHLNRHFRERGWIVWRDELHREVIDLGNCKAFAIPDHQVAHIYLNDPGLIGEVAETVRNLDGVADVFSPADRPDLGLDHERSGDLIAVANESSWFTYYYWEKDKRAPDYARTVDIHRKPGYDPVELFIDPRIRFPKAKVGFKLLKKFLGFRILMDVIPLEARLIRGSHGCVPIEEEDYPVLIGPLHGLENGSQIKATDVYENLFKVCVRGQQAVGEVDDNEELSQEKS